MAEQIFGRAPTSDGLKPKDLCGIPLRLAFALQADGWWLRSEIIWSKSNPMPESVTDRPTKAHEQLFLLTKSPNYYYDAEAIREPQVDPERMRLGEFGVKRDACREDQSRNAGHPGYNPAGRNRRTVREIATSPFPEAHFATFPPALVEPCILAGCPQKCCAKCGAPWVREVERGQSHYEQLGKNVGSTFGRGDTDPRNQVNGGGQTRNASGSVPSLRAATSITLGFSPSCDCWERKSSEKIVHDPYPLVTTIREYGPPDSIPGTVLDPFGGAGTTGLVADRLGRNAILIELNPQYAEMAERRLRDDAGMFAMIAAE